MSTGKKGILPRLVVPVLIIFTFTQIFAVFPVAAAPQFTFVAAGDYAFNGSTTNVWTSMHGSNPNFILADGDFLYTVPTSTVNEQTWCNQFKATAGPNVELTVGNHETWESNVTDGGGSINKFLKYCPFTLPGGVTGTYGFRYYFDYPSPGPIARFINVDPGIWNGTSGSSAISYASGTDNFNWVSNAIDNARAIGIQWIIVVMHKVCIDTGTTGCEVQPTFMTMLLNKRVDLIIQGHDHTYERTKQLTCEVDGTYNSSCVADAGSSVTKGAGTVSVIDGTGGSGGGKTVATNPDNGYFAAYCCSTGTPLGYSLYTVSTNQLTSKFVNTPGGQSYSDSFTINAATGFTLTANPSSISMVDGHNANTKITATSVNGFTGTVTFSAKVSPSTGLTATIGPLSVSVPKGGSASTTLTVSAKVFGLYVVNVTGVSGAFSSSVFVKVKVSDFSLSATPSELRFAPKSSASSTITVSSLEEFSGGVNLAAKGAPAGLNFAFSKGSVTVPANGNASSILTITSGPVGTFNVTVTGSGAGLTRSVFIAVIVTTAPLPDFTVSASPTTVGFDSGSSGSTTLSATGLSGFQGTLNITSTVSPLTGLSVSCNPSNLTLSATTTTGSSLCTITSSVAGNYALTLKASNGTVTHSASVTVNVNDFKLTVSPSVLNNVVGSISSDTLTLSSLGQFANTVALTVNPSSASVSASVSPSSLALTAGGSATSTLTLSATTAGNYTVQVTGTSDGLSHATTVTFTVGNMPDYSVTASPSSIAIAAGSSGQSSLTLTSLNGFTGTVSLASVVAGGTSGSLGCTLSPSSVSLATSATSTLSCNSSSNASGTFTVTVTATSGALSHSAAVMYSVSPTPDFTITASPASVSAINGTAGTSSITLASLNGFNNTVSLTASLSPTTGLACSLSPASVTLQNGGSGNSTLSCTGSAVGAYTVSVTGTSGSTSHSTSMTFQVTGTVSAPSYALVTTFQGQVYKYQNGTLTLIGQPVTTALRLISWKPDGSYALIAGDSAVLLKWDGSTLTQIPTTGVMSAGDDLNVVAFNPDGSYALIGGTDGDLLKWDGTSLTRINDPNTHQIQGISWNPTTKVALLVGNGGALFTYNNGVITILNSGTTNDLYGVAWNPNGAYAIISGGNGSILKWDGTTATALNTAGLYPTTTIVRYVAWNGAGTQALLTGNAGGLLLSYDGTSLTVISSGTSNGLFSLAWSGNTATIVGNSGTILTCNGATVTPVVTGVTSDFRGIAWKPA